MHYAFQLLFKDNYQVLNYLWDFHTQLVGGKTGAATSENYLAESVKAGHKHIL